MLREKGHGAKFCSLISGNITHIVGYAFVDDTDLVTFEMFEESITLDDITEKMQDSIDLWEGGLKATGGAIVPEKSWIYPLDFDFDAKGNAQYRKLQDMPYQFTVKKSQRGKNQSTTI